MESFSSSDEVKIIACECLDYFVQFILKNREQNKIVFDVITKGLKESDDVECSGISYFNLLCKFLTNKEFNSNQFMNIQVLIPYLYHKIY